MSKKHTFGLTLVIALLVASQGLAQETTAPAQKKNDDDAAPIKVAVAGGKLGFTAPGTWEKVQPKSNMLDVEFKIPRKGEDAADGRMTLMSAGGSVQANIDRWKGQFTGEKTSDVKETTVAGQKVHLVNIGGTFMESAGGPFGPKTKRENYRMLAAIIEYGTSGKYFIKLTGPKGTLDANKDKFEAFVKSLQVAK